MSNGATQGMAQEALIATAGGLCADRGGEPLLDRAKRIAPLISSHAEAAERNGLIPQPVLEAMGHEGLLSFWLPRCFGGEETMPVAALEALEMICHADASVGWVTMATQLCSATAAAYLPASAARAIFSEGIAIIGGQGQPFGKAVPEQGGYRLSGAWSYGSGVRHSDYLHTGGIIYRDGEPDTRPGGAPDVKIFIVPVAEARLLGNWETLGLRATGSVDYAIDGAYVPADFLHDLIANAPNQGGDLYRLGIPGFSAIGHTAFALGVARRALDELSSLMGENRQPTYMSSGGNENFLIAYGNAEGKLRSIRAFALETWGAIQKTLEAGEDPTVRQGTLMRLVVNYATSVAAEIATFAFRFGGGRATRDGALQRCFRDMQTGAQHATASPPVLAECARELLNQAPGKRWGFRNLIPAAQT